MTHETWIKAVTASGFGALPGFDFECSCGYSEGYAIRSMTEDAARSHREYMARKEAKIKRMVRGLRKRRLLAAGLTEGRM